MLASVLDQMGLNPTFLIGGIVRAYGSNAHSGTGRYYVVEADESDKSFMHLSPAAVIVTNVEADHLDHYRDFDEAIAAMVSMDTACEPQDSKRADDWFARYKERRQSMLG